MAHRSPAPDTDLKVLDPREVRLARDAFGRLGASLPGGQAAAEVHPVRAFPLTAPGECVFLRGPDDEDLGVIERVDALDPASRQALEEELALIYFVTAVRAVRGVRARHGVTTWEFATDRGPCTVHVRDRTDIRRLGGGRLVFTDVNGMRFEVANAGALDEQSQAFIDAET